MRRAIVRTVAAALEDVERCAGLVGDNQQARALLGSAGEKLRQAVSDLQRFLSPLGGPALDGRDLRGSLERLADYARRVLGAPLEAHIDPAVAGALAPAQVDHVLRIVQEGLANAIAHSGATRMALRATVENGRLVVRLSDDGQGFDLRRQPARRDGGLAVMQSRADAAGGLLSVASAPEAGTIVTLTLPLSS